MLIILVISSARGRRVVLLEVVVTNVISPVLLQYDQIGSFVNYISFAGFVIGTRLSPPANNYRRGS